MSRPSTRSQTSSAAASTQLSAVAETQYEVSPIPPSQPGPMRDPPASHNPNEINLVSLVRSDSFSTQPMPEEYYIRPVETSLDVFESKEFNRPSQPTMPNWESPPSSLPSSSSSSGGIVSLPPPIEPVRRVTRAAASQESKSIETVPVIVDPEEKYSPVEPSEPEDEYVIEEIVARYEYKEEDESLDVFYEIKWKGFPDTQNTLEPGDKIPNLRQLRSEYARKQKEQKRPTLRDNWDITQKTKGPKGDRLREIVTSLYNYTNQDIRDMEIYAQTWLDMKGLTALQIAREIAKVHHWDWSDQEYTDPVFDLADPEDGEPIENLRDALSQPESSIASSEPVEPLPSEVLDRMEYKEGKRKDIQKFQEVADDDLKQLFEEELKRVDHLNSVLPNIVIIDLEVHNLESKMISQICVVKLDGSLGFNRYIKRKIKPFLAEEWQFLVENQWVDLDYSDDPDKAVSFPDAILDMCKLFIAGTLFLFKGTTDYFTLVTNFKHHMAPSRADKTLESIREFRSKQYRFSSLDRLLNLAQFPRKLDKRIEPLYNTMFNQSLLINTEIKMLVYSATIRKELSKLFQTEYKLMDPSFKLDRNQEHEKVDIWFWTDGNMQPVFHLAHTDALMTRNVVIALLLYLDLKERFPSEQLLWEQLMTAIVAKTTAFRQYHLGCSHGAANRLWTILEKNKKKFNNSYDLPLDIEVTKPVEAKTRFHREKEFYASEFPSPEREEDELRNVIKSLRQEEEHSLDGPIYIDEKNPEGKFEVFKDLVIEAVNPQRGNIKKETMHELIWQNKQLLEGKGCRLPKGYLFHRSDLQNFQELQDKRNYNNKPCLLIMHANTQERFPKTYVLHQSKCRHVSYETSNSRNRKSYQQSLSVLDFNEKSEFSYRMRFCKECKMTSAVKSHPQLIRASLLKDQPNQRVKLEQQQQQQPNNMMPQLFQPVINVNPQIFLPPQQQQQKNRRAAGVSDALVQPSKPLMGLPFVPSQNLSSRYNFRRRGDL